MQTSRTRKAEGMDESGHSKVLAFVIAMPMEAKPLIKRLGLRETDFAGPKTYEGWLRSRRVVAVITGMGTELATEGTNRLLDKVNAEWVVNPGITGAIDDETPIGTLVVPEVVVNSATGAEYRPHQLGVNAPMGKMWTTDELTGPAALPALRAKGVVSLDMETAAIGAVCQERGVPWSTFRVISDRASDGSVDAEVYAMSNQDGTPNIPRVIKYFVRHPGALPAMARLAKGANLATVKAVDVALAACAAF